MATKKRPNSAKNKKPGAKVAAVKKSTASAVSAVKSTKTGQKAGQDTLNKWNIGLAVVLLAQAIVILVISKSVSVPVVEHFLAKDTLATQVTGKTVWALGIRHLFDIYLASIIASVLIVAAVVRGLAGTLRRKNYEADLAARVNKMRWTEYGLAGGLLITTLALVNGIYDISQLISLFALTLLAALVVFVLENYKVKFAPWLVNSFAVLTALLPWLLIAQYLKGALIFGDGLPRYAYWLDGVLFALFIGQSINFYLMRRGKGRWNSYIYGEQGFMLLSLASYSVLAWLVFAGALR